MARALFALLNLALIVGTAGVGVYRYRRAVADVAGVKGSRMLNSRVRGWYFSNLVPFEMLFVRIGVRPIALTYAQGLVSLGVALAYAAGFVFNAGVLVLLTGTLDVLDGKVARRANGASRRGAFLDSVIDRYAEFAGYVGLIVLFGSGWRVWAVLVALLGGMMVSYARARAEGLEVACEIGLLQRPERFVILGFGSLFSSIADHLLGGEHAVLMATILLLGALSNITAVQRIAFVSRKLAGVRDA